MILITLQEALAHPWLSGKNATDHNLLPEIKAYMAKARLRRGIEMVKLANRIEMLKMQEDDSEESDLPNNATAAAKDAIPGSPERTNTTSSTASGSTSLGEKKSLSKIAKGAIFREVVLAKVREVKAEEAAAQIERQATEAAKKHDTN